MSDRLRGDDAGCFDLFQRFDVLNRTKLGLSTGELLSIFWVGPGGTFQQSEQTRMVWIAQFALIEMVLRLGPDT